MSVSYTHLGIPQLLARANNQLTFRALQSFTEGVFRITQIESEKMCIRDRQLMDEVWGYETEADPHTIEVHIGRIRERLKDNPDFEIVTMRGIGYKVVKK